MSAKDKKPVVLICSNFVDVEGYPAHVVKHQYVRPLVEICGAIPLLVPAIGEAFNLDDYIHAIDGILLTGAPAHVAPSHYGHERRFEDEWLDEARDSTSLPMIRAAVRHNVPMFTICRGFQELNVACGGTLFQYVHEQPGKKDHRENETLSIPDRFTTHKHEVTAEKDGLFDAAGVRGTFTVNSLHTQGIDTLAPDLRVEAMSDDGLIEAVSHTKARFIMGTQWHPEGDVHVNENSKRLFEAFGASMRA